MDWVQVGKIIAILGAASGLLYGFINSVWPRLMRLGAVGRNTFLLRRARDQLKDSDRRVLSSALDSCKDVIQRSEVHKLQKQRDTALQLIESLQHRLRHRVRFFLLAKSLDRERFASLLLSQNTIQPLFQFELGHVVGYSQLPVEDKLSSIDSTLKPGRFIELCEQVLVENEMHDHEPSPQSPIRIVVTQAALPRNFYLWGHFEGAATWYDPPKEQWGTFAPNKFWVVSLAFLEQTLPNISVERFLLRVIQRACVLSVLPSRRKGSPDRLSHHPTYGCLFDFTALLADMRYYVSQGFVCEDCASNILEAEEIPSGHRSDFLHALQKWLVDTDNVHL